MKQYKRAFWVLGITAVVCALAATAIAQSKANAGKEGHSGAQSAADALRSQAGADGAFISATYVKSNYNPKDLASLVQYPTEGIVVLKLKGSQIRAALEHAVSLYPQSSVGFLQVSGFTIDVNASAAPEKRITGITTDSGPLDDSREYQIAMPTLLGRGGMGYASYWNKNAVARTLDGTLESVLKGKSESSSTSRWRIK